jgi:ketosteroid isomerase-like protein
MHIRMLVVVGTLAGIAPPAAAQDAAGVAKQWSEAFAAGDIARSLALYHESATFVGPRSKEVGRDREAARAYLSAVFGASTERSAACGEPIVKPRGDATVVAGTCQLSVAFKDGKKLASPIRYHMVMQKSGAGFVITDHHFSLLPAD